MNHCIPKPISNIENDSRRLSLSVPDENTVIRPKLVVLGVGGAGGNAVNNMIQANLQGVEFVVANTDAQALADNLAPTKIQLGDTLTEGLGAGADPAVGKAAAEESMDRILDILDGAHMVFITAGMGGGTGSGAAPEIARELKECGILTVSVITKPFEFEGIKRQEIGNIGINALNQCVDTMIVIPNQHLHRITSEKVLFADAMKMADEVLYNGVRAISDLIVGTGAWNLDFADVRTLMTNMGKAMMGTGEAEGEGRAKRAAELAITNPLLEDMDLMSAKGVLINISAGEDLTFYEVEQVATRVRAEIPNDTAIMVGQCHNPELNGRLRVSVITTGLEASVNLSMTESHSEESQEPDHTTLGTTEASSIDSLSPAPKPPMMQQIPPKVAEPTLNFGTSYFPEQNIELEEKLSPKASDMTATSDAYHPHYQQPNQQPNHQPISHPSQHAPMPTHRDSQAINELKAANLTAFSEQLGAHPAPQQYATASQAQEHAVTNPPLAATAYTQSSSDHGHEANRITAYEQALIDAKRSTEAYERERAALQAHIQAENDAATRLNELNSLHGRHNPPSAANPQQIHQNQPKSRPVLRPEQPHMRGMENQPQSTLPPRNAQPNSDSGIVANSIFGQMRQMISNAAKPHNRENAPTETSNNTGSSTTATTESNGFDWPPSGPGGGQQARHPADSNKTTTTMQPPIYNGSSAINAPQSQASSEANSTNSARMVQATEQKIHTITNNNFIDEPDDGLLMDIPAFLRRQHN